MLSTFLRIGRQRSGPEPPERQTAQPQPVQRAQPGRPDAARSAGRRAVYVAIEVAAVCIGAVVLLVRIAGVPAWDSVYPA